MVLGYSNLSTQSLQEIRRLVWPDSVFFSESFYAVRTRSLARSMLFSNSSHRTAVRFYKSILYNDGRIDLGDTGDRTSRAAQRYWDVLRVLVDGMTSRMSIYPPRPPRHSKLHLTLDDLVIHPSVRTYTAMIKDVVLSACGSSHNEGRNGRSRPYYLRSTLKLPIILMFQQTLANSFYPLQRRFQRRTSNTRPSENAQVALHLWLRAIKDAGIDLLFYAELEMPRIISRFPRP